jgi:hypothetical protein
MLDWAFRSRETGRLTFAQVPNVPLWTWIASALVHRFLGLPHDADRVVSVVGTIALVVWALDELLRGVNPWRRFLGAGVLVMTLLP